MYVLPYGLDLESLSKPQSNELSQAEEIEEIKPQEPEQKQEEALTIIDTEESEKTPPDQDQKVYFSNSNRTQLSFMLLTSIIKEKNSFFAIKNCCVIVWPIFQR